LKEKISSNSDYAGETAANYDDGGWQRAFKDTRDDQFGQMVKTLVYRANFTMPDDFDKATITFFYKSLGKYQDVYVNGKEVGHQLKENNQGNEFKLDASFIHPGKNTIAIVAVPLIKMNTWASVNQDPGLIQINYPAPAYQRKLFSGYAQVIVQSTGQPGDITLQAISDGIKSASVTIKANK
jgi:beta-galactosidase